jgi:hypothetical protein
MSKHSANLALFLALATTMAVLGAAPAWSAAGCTAQSPTFSVPVVELYTSEGCNSCPPADRWLSRLKGDSSVVAMAFHVDYWDRLGWKDRFGSPAHTQRQAQQQASNGARFSYTPQIVVDGIDQPRWVALALPGSVRAPKGQASPMIDIRLTREGARVIAAVHAKTGAPPRLAAYWAVTEDGHRSAVSAGENQGVTLHHDFVVRQYAEVPPWKPVTGVATEFRFEVGQATSTAYPASINLVVLDAGTRRPLQAVKLGC